MNEEQGPGWKALCWSDERGAFHIRTTDRFFIDVMPLLYTMAVTITKRGSNEPFYEDRWCYSSFEAARAAIESWVDPDAWPDSEPTGWHRHPVSGRRRPDGDPAQEYVSP